MSLDEGATRVAFFITNHQPLEDVMNVKTNVKAGFVTAEIT